MLIATLVLNSLVVIASGATGGHLHALDEAPQRIAGGECKDGDTRIVDGDWHRDFSVSPRVTMEEATLIIRALRRGDIESKLPWPTKGPRAGIAPVMPFIDANQVRSIGFEHAADGARVFNLQTGCWSGRFYHIALVSGKLVLLLVGYWIT